MQNLISVHSTSISTRIWIMLFIAFGLSITVGGVFQRSLDAVLTGLLFVIGPILLFGVSGKPARHLEIYEEGIKYQTPWRTRTWYWSDIVGITLSSRRLSSPVFTHINGDYISLDYVSDWRKAVRHVVSNVQPLIYRNMLSRIDEGQAVQVNPHLAISKSGFKFRGYFIEWAAVKSVRMNKNVLIIEGKSDGNEWQRLNVSLRYTSNATIFAELIPAVWREAINTPQPVETPFVVIDGVRFNSEGEIINHAANE